MRLRKFAAKGGCPNTMSIRVINAIWKHFRQQKSGPLVVLAIADYANADGIAWPAVSTLAQKTRMSRSNAWDYIKNKIYDAMSKRNQNQKITRNSKNEKRR